MKTIEKQIKELEALNKIAYADLARKATSRFNGYSHIASYEEICNAGQGNSHLMTVVFKVGK